ncbi:retrovirus-related pol polyprotein from transposon TNT 1-94 [Tanacetum coccineum]
MSRVTMDPVKPKVLAPGMYAINVEPIPLRLKNNKDAHLDYLTHLKESVETICEIVEEARLVKPLDNVLAFACSYKKRSQKLLEYVISTFPKESINTQKHVVQQQVYQSNVSVIPSTGISNSTEASRSKPRSNTKNNRILLAKSENKKKVEDHPKTNKYRWTKVNRVDSSISSKSVVIKSNSESVCKTCNKCLISANHDMCVVTNLNFVNENPTFKNGLNKAKKVWKEKGKLSANGLNKTKQVVQIVLWYLGSGCSKYMTENRSKLKNFVKKFIGTVRFGNDHFGQFYDSNLEVAFRKHSYFVRDMDGVDFLKGCRSTNLYTVSVDEMMKSSPICLLARASKNKSWLKFEKDYLCSACQLGKSKKYSHKPKSKNTNMEVLHTLYMDLCGPMRVQSINGKKYILVIVDDYSRFSWVKFLRSKDETPEFVTKFLKQIQVGLNKTVRFIRTDNGTEFVNQVMTEFYERVGIFHQKSVQRTP